jgi:hypothetical protein
MRLSDTSPDVLEDLATTHMGQLKPKPLMKKKMGCKKTQRFMCTHKIPPTK